VKQDLKTGQIVLVTLMNNIKLIDIERDAKLPGEKHHHQ
jgi:hypothetical protein